LVDTLRFDVALCDRSAPLSEVIGAVAAMRAAKRSEPVVVMTDVAAAGDRFETAAVAALRALDVSCFVPSALSGMDLAIVIAEQLHLARSREPDSSGSPPFEPDILD